MLHKIIMKGNNMIGLDNQRLIWLSKNSSCFENLLTNGMMQMTSYVVEKSIGRMTLIATTMVIFCSMIYPSFLWKEKSD